MPDTGRLMVGGDTRWFKFDLNEGDETVASLLILNHLRPGEPRLLNREPGPSSLAKDDAELDLDLIEEELSEALETGSDPRDRRNGCRSNTSVILVVLGAFQRWG